jgi:hypothetical protein
MFQVLISPLAVVLSLSTSSGILLHETKMDKLAALTMMAPVTAAQKIATQGAALLEGMPHTHIEPASLESSSNELRNKTPNQNPRRNEDKKYQLQKKVSRGVHLFDSYHLPLDQLAV